MTTLRSYLGDRWVEGSGVPQALVNPATEEPLAQVASEGLDVAAALEHARKKGGPALRALSFAERGNLLKEAAKTIQAHRDELLELEIANGGNTRSDAKFDVDGAVATLHAYADIGETLGGAKFLIDGEGLQLGRSPRFHGQHVRVPRHGVAVQINAFNFPAWGFAEKAAPALLAGMPVFFKPATSSAMAAHRVMEILVEKSVLPEGTLSLLVGGQRELPALLGAQDVLAFTGSGDTGARVRALRNVLIESVRVNVEADSLNAAVLGPDAGPGGDMYETFLKDVLRDMTQKAGQKCTAIRRVLVPAEHAGTVRDDLVEGLKSVRVGNPALEETRMGPVATAAQLADVREGVARLCAEGKAAFGSAAPLDGKGYFISPVLMEFVQDAAATAVHAREVFGPVASLLPYSGKASAAAAIVARGNGCLVSSVYSEDSAFLEDIVAAIAPYHGRLFLGHPKIEMSPGPGTVLPQLVHGGPGRAGGGEELGGERGLAFYMQHVALEGSRPVIQKLIGLRPAAAQG
ncbi:MAG TPA: 3,4-dehydroadipyl-CoA semialdehyde dehydrogenase [Burkholderiales bacterium]|jgi:3,4-dehydroadipyl-CoA semialdehyde dehydrogenase|nr:3,4-dehydroadipyl-CoA semialdehyde dehydrogenase [Burkholderiales bacterium]